MKLANIKEAALLVEALENADECMTLLSQTSSQVSISVTDEGDNNFTSMDIAKDDARDFLRSAKERAKARLKELGVT